MKIHRLKCHELYRSKTKLGNRDEIIFCQRYLSFESNLSN